MKKILIVEDETFLLDLYVVVFTRSDFEVDSASDGEEALAKIRQHRYDVILLDLMIPKVNGIEILKVIRNNDSVFKNTPVFILTNLSQEHTHKEALAIGASGYLIKSQVTPKDIVASVTTFLEKTRVPAPATA